MRNLKRLSREVFCCVSEQSHGAGWSRLLPKEIMKELGEEASLPSRVTSMSE